MTEPKIDEAPPPDAGPVSPDTLAVIAAGTSARNREAKVEFDSESGADELRERLAAIEHQRWADWQRYVHASCVRAAGGHLTIPARLVERWERQIATPYADLPEDEKVSDRHQVDRYWHILAAENAGLREALAAPQAECAKVIEVRAKVAAEIRALCECAASTDLDIARSCEYDRAARIAEGKGDET